MNLSSRAEASRIIVADDHARVRRVVVEVINQTLPAAAIIETSDGLQAFHAYEHGGCHFLLSNHNMPGMDGLALIRQVRRRAAALPIWMISDDPQAERNALAAGATGFLRKEAITTDLPKLLRQYVGQIN